MNLPIELLSANECAETKEATEFACIVRTPQHRKGQVYDYTVQRGIVNKVNWHFKGVEHISGSVGKHDITFRTEECFMNFRIL